MSAIEITKEMRDAGDNGVASQIVYLDQDGDGSFGGLSEESGR